MNKVFITLLLLISLPTIAMDYEIDDMDDPELVEAHHIAELKTAIAIVELKAVDFKLNALATKLCKIKQDPFNKKISTIALTIGQQIGQVKTCLDLLKNSPFPQVTTDANCLIHNYRLQEPYICATI